VSEQCGDFGGGGLIKGGGVSALGVKAGMRRSDQIRASQSNCCKKKVVSSGQGPVEKRRVGGSKFACAKKKKEECGTSYATDDSITTGRLPDVRGIAAVQ